MAGLARRATEGGSWWVRVSLCQTAAWIERSGRVDPAGATGIGDVRDLLLERSTDLGQVTYLGPAARMSATPPRWELPVQPLGASPPVWAS